MLDDLREDERVEIAAWLKEVSVAKGSFLYREGDPATEAGFLLDGELEVMRALPGGGETRLTTIAPGEMIGEMALVAGGTRSANVRALKPSSVLIVSRYFFDAALHQMSAPAFRILRALTRRLAERSDRLRLQILQELGCDVQAPPGAESFDDDNRRNDAAGGAASFDYRAFLPIIPGFEVFTSAEIDRFLRRTSVIERACDEILYREQSPAAACFILIRGALEVSVTRDRRYQLAILGPGRFAGAHSLISQSVRTDNMRFRSDALLLALDHATFADLYSGETVLSMKFQRMVTSSLLQDLRVADNLLTTLVSKSHIRERTTLPAN